jgi:hypothetical protein
MLRKHSSLVGNPNTMFSSKPLTRGSHQDFSPADLVEGGPLGRGFKLDQDRRKSQISTSPSTLGRGLYKVILT